MMRLQAVRILCRKGAKKFGVEQSDEHLQEAIDAFIRSAR